jgi:hypothetical protein
MPTWEHELDEAPADLRARELWLQHAAGFIFFEDVRRFAMERIDPALTAETRAAVEKGIDEAVYGLMMVIDGVSGSLSNVNRSVYIDFVVRFVSRGDNGAADLVSEVDLRHGDGMCMAYHGWLQGDFGKDPVAKPRPETGK